jgi:hypothetical protein
MTLPQGERSRHVNIAAPKGIERLPGSPSKPLSSRPLLTTVRLLARYAIVEKGVPFMATFS